MIFIKDLQYEFPSNFRIHYHSKRQLESKNWISIHFHGGILQEHVLHRYIHEYNTLRCMQFFVSCGYRISRATHLLEYNETEHIWVISFSIW